MKLIQAVSEYVAMRRAEGAQFIGSQRVLQSMCKHEGEISLENLSEERIAAFLNLPQCGIATRASKFSIVKCFVNFWSDHGQMPALRLTRPERRPTTLPPFIYTIAEVRRLLHSADKCQRPFQKMSGHTLRMILLTLYATGATTDEVLGLRRSSVDPRRRRIVFASSPSRYERSIPIGDDLKKALAPYIVSSRSSKSCDLFLFGYTNGQRVTWSYLHGRFRRLLAIARVGRTVGRRPRLCDLRFTFAVHRLTHWIRQKDDLNVLVPALSTYMGYANLTKAEQFLSYTPERFRSDLQKLSPKRAHKPWRDQPELMRSLASL